MLMLTKTITAIPVVVVNNSTTSTTIPAVDVKDKNNNP